tara:strand:+ start:27063 stop:27713 length:651 start_codon:yes stop_codon:yes gene_type:complete
MSIEKNLKKIKKEIPGYVTLIAVSKTKPATDIEKAYKSGQLDFGENKVQELMKKVKILPSDIKWHMIGHLQRNKVKDILPIIHMIHSVDSLRLIKEIDKQAGKIERKISLLLQVDISQDETKYGFSFKDLESILKSNELDNFKNISIDGLMGMASFTENSEIIKAEFKKLSSLFDKFKKKYFLKYLSMGMSGDYKIAMECNSNMVRLGSNIFGSRN